MRIVAVASILLLVLLAVHILRQQKRVPIDNKVEHPPIEQDTGGESPYQTAFSEPDAPVMEEYVLPAEYTLPPVDNPQPQVKESPHRWSASSLWRDHKGKIIGGVVGTVAVAVAGGVALSRKRDREVYMYDHYNDPNRETWAENAELDEDELDAEIRRKRRERQLDTNLRTFDDLTFDDPLPRKSKYLPLPDTSYKPFEPEVGFGDFKVMEPYREEPTRPFKRPSNWTWGDAQRELNTKQKRREDRNVPWTGYTFQDLVNDDDVADNFYDAHEPEDTFYNAAEPVSTWRDKALEVNKRLGLGDWLSAKKNEKWEPPPGTDYEDLWERGRDWG